MIVNNKIVFKSQKNFLMKMPLESEVFPHSLSKPLWMSELSFVKLRRQLKKGWGEFDEVAK